MNLVTEILAAVFGIGLLYYIINGALKNIRYLTRGIVNLTVAFFLAGVFSFALWRDYRGDAWLNYYIYFVFISVSLIYGAAYGYYLLRYVRGSRRLSKRVISKYYFTDYLYVVYRYENNIYLQKKKDKFQGLVFRLKKTDYHDSYLHSLNNKLKITGRTDIYKIGKITDLRKRKVYFCYVITLFEKQEIINLESINAYQLINVNQDDFDKEILYRIILGEHFDIEK
jgi:hypothetical protein